jgi:hypothetical protein
MLGQALLNRGADADLSRTFEVFRSANLTNLKPDLVDPLTIGAVRAERREALEQIFGREGLESAILALKPGSILWTDDLVLAEVAKSELGVERVWTQAVAEHLANRGLIDRSLADEVHAKLMGFDFQSTHFTGAVMLAALRVSNGAVDAPDDCCLRDSHYSESHRCAPIARVALRQRRSLRTSGLPTNCWHGRVQ